jgi:hypothetical protein
MYQIGIERRSPVGADNRSRTDHLDLGKVAFCQLNYVRKLQRWQPMRVLPHLPGPVPDSEHRSCPACRHTSRQRFYNLPELLEIVPVPGYSGMGLMSFHQGYLYLPQAGRRFQPKLDSNSKASWTLIPAQPGQPKVIT